MSDQYLLILEEIVTGLGPITEAENFDARHQAGMRVDALKWILGEYRRLSKDPDLERRLREPAYQRISTLRRQRDRFREACRVLRMCASCEVIPENVDEINAIRRLCYELDVETGAVKSLGDDGTTLCSMCGDHYRGGHDDCASL